MVTWTIAMTWLSTDPGWPPPAPPPLAPAIPHLVHGSLRYTVEFDLLLTLPLVLVFFFFRIDGYSFGGARLSVAARFRHLLETLAQTDAVVASRCGADARDYLVLLRHILVALLVICVPGVCVLLPIAVHLGTATGAGDENDAFARTTVHHIPNGSPYLWAVVATSAVAVCAVSTVADEVRHKLVRRRYARAELIGSVAGVTVLLRRLPASVTSAPRALEAALDARFPGRVHAVVVPRDSREHKLQRAAARARAKLRAARRRVQRSMAAAGAARASSTPRNGGGDGTPAGGGDTARNTVSGCAAAAAAAEDALTRFRRRGGRSQPPTCAFAVFKDPLTARRAVAVLKPTWRGALVSWMRWALPFRVAWAFGAGLGAETGIGEGFERAGGEGGDWAGAALRGQGVEASPSDRAGMFSFGGDANGASGSGVERLPEAIALGVGAGVHWWRADHAPPPSGVLFDNVNVSGASRFLRWLFVNGAVTLGLLFVSSPLALFSFVNDLAKSLNPEMDSWDEWVRWAKGHGYVAGFVFQFLPNLMVVLMIYVFIPLVMERATQAERHLTRSGALRSLVHKEFWYYLINVLLLLALGKAALSATVQQVRQCQWKVEPDACELRFVSILGDAFVATTAMSICGFLITCSTLGPAWELLAFFSWVGMAVKRRSAAHQHAAAADRDGDNLLGTPRAARPPNGMPLGAWGDANTPHGSGHAAQATLPLRPVFDLPGQHAFNVTVLACTLAYAALAPILLIPGTLFFVVRYLVHKHNLLCLHHGNVRGSGDDLFNGRGWSDIIADDEHDGGVGGAGAGPTSGTAVKASDGQLLTTLVHLMRVSAFIHAGVMAAFLTLRGNPAQRACSAMILAAVVLRAPVERALKGPNRGLSGGVPVGSVDRLSSSVVGTGRGLDAAPEILLESTRYAGSGDTGADALRNLGAESWDGRGEGLGHWQHERRGSFVFGSRGVDWEGEEDGLFSPLLLGDDDDEADDDDNDYKKEDEKGDEEEDEDEEVE